MHPRRIRRAPRPQLAHHSTHHNARRNMTTPLVAASATSRMLNRPGFVEARGDSTSPEIAADETALGLSGDPVNGRLAGARANTQSGPNYVVESTTLWTQGHSFRTLARRSMPLQNKGRERSRAPAVGSARAENGIPGMPDRARLKKRDSIGPLLKNNKTPGRRGNVSGASPPLRPLIWWPRIKPARRSASWPPAST